MVAANYFRNKKLALSRANAEKNRANARSKYGSDHETTRDFNQNDRSTQPERGVSMSAEREHGASEAVGYSAKEMLQALRQEHPRNFVVMAAKIDEIVQQMSGLSDPYYLRDPRLASLVIKRLHPYDQNAWRAYSEDASDVPILLRVTRFLKEQTLKSGRFERATKRPQMMEPNGRIDEHTLRRLAKAQLGALPSLEFSAPAYQIVRFADILKRVVSMLTTNKSRLLSDEQMVFKAWNRLNPFYTWRWNLYVAKQSIGTPELSALARFMTDEVARLAQGPPAPKPVQEDVRAGKASKPVQGEMRAWTAPKPVQYYMRAWPTSKPAHGDMRAGTASNPVQRDMRGGTASNPVQRDMRGGTASNPVQRDMRGGTASKPKQVDMRAWTSPKPVQDYMRAWTASKTVQNNMRVGTAPKPFAEQVSMRARTPPKPVQDYTRAWVAAPGASQPAERESALLCPCCGGAHRPARCGALLAMSVPERLRWARRERACPRCLRLHRHAGRCRAPRCAAPHCHRPHHTMLHTRSSVLS